MESINFYKYTGAGNNYIYIDARDINIDWVELSKNISDPNFGIGSDGLIILDKSNDADFSMRMFNRDGSEGEMCGNGMRCLARFAEDLKVVPQNKDKISIIKKYCIYASFITSINRPFLDKIHPPKVSFFCFPSEILLIRFNVFLDLGG